MLPDPACSPCVSSAQKLLRWAHAAFRSHFQGFLRSYPITHKAEIKTASENQTQFAPPRLGGLQSRRSPFLPSFLPAASSVGEAGMCDGSPRWDETVSHCFAFRRASSIMPLRTSWVNRLLPRLLLNCSSFSCMRESIKNGGGKKKIELFGQRSPRGSVFLFIASIKNIQNHSARTHTHTQNKAKYRHTNFKTSNSAAHFLIQ